MVSMKMNVNNFKHQSEMNLLLCICNQMLYRRPFWMTFFTKQQPTATNLLLKSFFLASYLSSFFWFAFEIETLSFNERIYRKNNRFLETKRFSSTKRKKKLIIFHSSFPRCQPIHKEIVTFGFDSTMKTLNVRFS